jgi:hypothetical protein
VLKAFHSSSCALGHHLEALASMDAAIDNRKHPSLTERWLKKLTQGAFPDAPARRIVQTVTRWKASL